MLLERCADCSEERASIACYARQGSNLHSDDTGGVDVIENDVCWSFFDRIEGGGEGADKSEKNTGAKTKRTRGASLASIQQHPIDSRIFFYRDVCLFAKRKRGLRWERIDERRPKKDVSCLSVRFHSPVCPFHATHLRCKNK